MTGVFENVLGQEDLVRSVRGDLERGELPGALLFEGPPNSAKLTAALELARAGSCGATAAWNCPCPDCARHRAMSHPDLLLLGPKSHREELAAGAAMLERSPGTASRYFFARAARKLARRFDRALYEGEEGRLAKAAPLVRSLMEGADACMPGGSTDTEAAATAKSLLAGCFKLNDLLPDSTPVFQVRALEAWARQTPFGTRKTVLIEHADRMLDAARNALLKILEEPPAHARFVLTTTRRQAIIPTLLSRVRRYRFLPRTADEARAVIERVFRDRAQPGASVDSYLGSFRAGGSAAVEEAAAVFASALAASLVDSTDGGGDPALARLAAGSAVGVREAIRTAAAATANFGAGDEAMAWSFQAFLDAAFSRFAALGRDPEAGRASLRLAERFARLSRDALMRQSSYNLNPVPLAERLAAAMEEPSP